MSVGNWKSFQYLLSTQNQSDHSIVYVKSCKLELPLPLATTVFIQTFVFTRFLKEMQTWSILKYIKVWEQRASEGRVPSISVPATQGRKSPAALNGGLRLGAEMRGVWCCSWGLLLGLWICQMAAGQSDAVTMASQRPYHMWMGSMESDRR